MTETLSQTSNGNKVELKNEINEFNEEVELNTSLDKEDDTSKLLEEMRAKLASIGLEEVPDKPSLLRFLRARNYKVDHAANMYYKNVQWRSKFLPAGRISEDEIAKEMRDRKAHLQICPGHAPLIILKACNHNAYTRDLKESSKFAVYSMEKAIALLPPNVEKFKVIVDFENITLRNLDSNLMIFVFEMLKSYYPERLDTLYMIHVPVIFWGIWKIVSPFIDPVTRKKIHFLEDKNLNILKNKISPELLPKEYDGNAEWRLVQDVKIN